MFSLSKVWGFMVSLVGFHVFPFISGMSEHKRPLFLHDAFLSVFMHALSHPDRATRCHCPRTRGLWQCFARKLLNHTCFIVSMDNKQLPIWAASPPQLQPGDNCHIPLIVPISWEGRIKHPHSRPPLLIWIHKHSIGAQCGINPSADKHDSTIFP